MAGPSTSVSLTASPEFYTAADYLPGSGERSSGIYHIDFRTRMA